MCDEWVCFLCLLLGFFSGFFLFPIMTWQFYFSVLIILYYIILFIILKSLRSLFVFWEREREWICMGGEREKQRGVEGGGTLIRRKNIVFIRRENLNRKYKIKRLWNHGSETSVHVDSRVCAENLLLILYLFTDFLRKTHNTYAKWAPIWKYWCSLNAPHSWGNLHGICSECAFLLSHWVVGVCHLLWN